MFLIVELLFIVLLAMVLLMLYKTERFLVKKRLPSAMVEEYWNGRERRQHVRFQKALEVTYIVEKRPHLNNNGKTVDISEGGIKILLGEKLSEGVILDLKVSLPGSQEPAELEGMVVWSEDVKEKDASGKRCFHSGVKFSAIKEPSGKRLINYIYSLASSQ